MGAAMDVSGRVFMLDDDGVILDLYQELFEAKGYEVFATTNAYQFLRYAREIRPDILLLDVNMPVINGWEILGVIHGDALLNEIPVVMMTVSRDVDLAIAKGAAHFLQKPLELDRLFEIVDAYCLGGRNDDILLLEDFDALKSPLERSIVENSLKYFPVHGLAAAKRYLFKNHPHIVCICHSGIDFENAKLMLGHEYVFRAERSDDIQKFLL